MSTYGLLTGMIMMAGAVLATGVVMVGGREPPPSAASTGQPSTGPQSETGPGAYPAAAGDELVLRRDRDGHFRVTLTVNGRDIETLIDTGASHLVLSPADAAWLGLRPDRRDFTHHVTTANGQVAVAPVELDRVTLGPFELDQVPALVHGGELSQSLLGMSVLDRLHSYQVHGDRLTLRQ